jgi:hypothetical protein
LTPLSEIDILLLDSPEGKKGLEYNSNKSKNERDAVEHYEKFLSNIL